MASSVQWTAKRLVAAPAPASRTPQMAFSMFELRGLHLALWLHTDQNPSEAEWSAGCQAFAELRQRCGESMASLRALVISDGGAPNARQRAQFFQPALGGMHRASAISIALSNPVKRGIATAITWLNPHFRAFEPERWSEAIAHVGLAAHIERVWSEFAELQRRLPANRTLRLVTGAARLRPREVAAQGMQV